MPSANHYPTTQPNVAVTETPFGVMKYLTNDDPIGVALTRYGEWSRAEIDMLSQFVSLGSTVVDVGANIGTHTLAFARLVGPEGRVIALEPQPEIFNILSENIANNMLHWTNALMAGAGSNALEMYLPNLDYNQHLNAGAVALMKDGVGTKVAVLNLDSLNLSNCQLIKIDAEGMESDVLRGAENLIAQWQPVLFMEVNSAEAAVDLYRYIKGRHYTIFLARTKAFNPYNLKACPENFFGVATETGLLCVPDHLSGSYRLASYNFELLPIGTIEELIFSFASSPRFGDVTVHDRDFSWWKAEFEREQLARLAIEDKCDQLLYRQSLLSRQLDKMDVENSLLRAQLLNANDANMLRVQASLREDELRKKLLEEQQFKERLLSSFSWRLMKPFRAIRRFIRI